ncbi:ABC transporter permease [Streptomyces sp. NPDC041068]|uniref:ABC transporter permease n=1 Tax=Streptomyces sp. NPDC041068 TaxID=3155130 RepID=UPI0033E7480F
MSLPTLHGPRWAELRLHRTALLTGGALVVVALAYTGWLRWAADAYPEPKGACSSHGTCETFLGFTSARDLLNISMSNGAVALLLVPLLIGVFVAGPMIGREMESGVYKLSWTQSVSPTRWLATKVTTAAAFAVGGTLALMAVFQLGASEMVGTHWNLHWADRGVYETTGPALVAYALLAVAVGTLAGLLVRRTLLAMAATGVVTGLVLLVLSSTRWHLVPTLTRSRPATADSPWGTMWPMDSFVMDQGVANAAGDRFYPGQCLPEPISGYSCPTDTKVVSAYADFHPRSHFWYVQLIETGIVLALAAAATYAAFRLLRRRVA